MAKYQFFLKVVSERLGMDFNLGVLHRSTLTRVHYDLGQLRSRLLVLSEEVVRNPLPRQLLGRLAEVSE